MSFLFQKQSPWLSSNISENQHVWHIGIRVVFLIGTLLLVRQFVFFFVVVILLILHLHSAYYAFHAPFSTAVSRYQLHRLAIVSTCNSKSMQLFSARLCYFVLSYEYVNNVLYIN